MTKSEIYQLLKAKKITTPMIGESLNVTPQSIRSVIATGKGSRRIAQAIADTCEKNLYEIFPHYKALDGEKQQQEKIQAALNEKLARFA